MKTTDYAAKGEALFRAEPELILAEVWWRAAKLYPDDFVPQYEFVGGYSAARRRRDALEQERRSA